MPRPDGAPFWGESLPLQFAQDDADEFINDLDKRAGTYTFSAGESLRCWIGGDFYNYLQAGDSAVVSWVVEVTSGSGVLRLTDGHSAEALEGSATVDQGTRTASGGVATLVWSSSVTAADILDGVYPLALIECESGSVEVQQIKLRVWPSGGPLGKLSDPVDEPEGSAVTNVTFGQYLSAFGDIGDEFIYADDETATAAAVSGYLLDDDGGPVEGATYDVGTRVFLTNEPQAVFTTGAASYLFNVEQDTGSPFLWKATISSFRFSGWVRGLLPSPRSSVPGDEGVDWIYHPNEVWTDHLSRAYTTGETETWWPALEFNVAASVPGPWTLTARESDVPEFPSPITSGTFTYPDTDALLTSATGSFDDSVPWTPPAGLLSFQVDLKANGSDSAATAPPEPSGPEVFTELTVDLIDPTTSFGQFNMRYRRPPYRVWIPKSRAPHQIFQRGDGLGAGSSRVLDPGTRQTTERVYGTF